MDNNMGPPYEIKNAIIKSATITRDGDHGCLSAWVHLDYGGSAESFGGYALYLPRDFKNHTLWWGDCGYAGHFIWRVMEVAEVDEWSKLPGKPVRADIEDGIICGIGHITKDIWFCPKDEFK